MGFPGDSMVKNLSLLYIEFISLLYTRIYLLYTVVVGFPGGSDGKESICNTENLGLIHGFRRSPRGRGSTLGLLPRESQGQRSLASCNPQGQTEPNMTEAIKWQQQQHSGFSDLLVSGL